ncbi:transcriptional regulator [Paenibacillus popilliae]|uniref:transcriptional regulator n=1 Tax=Paenibacillus popilliae TaxID=78057 RepID=UPI00163C6D2E|nr:transcriptional regulator [Paenibacillus sp. SDF0028]
MHVHNITCVPIFVSYKEDCISVPNISVLSRIESGKRPVEHDEINLFADFFTVTGDYLLGRTDNPTLNTDKQPSNQEDDEFEAFINDPQHGIFFKEYLEAPEERKKELMQFWRIIKEAEKGRRLGDRQGE